MKYNRALLAPLGAAGLWARALDIAPPPGHLEPTRVVSPRNPKWKNYVLSSECRIAHGKASMGGTGVR
jgi:hypothetical protein